MQRPPLHTSNAPRGASPINLPHLDDYLLALQTNNYSSETVYNYERDLTVFAQFLDDARVPFDKINKQHINYYKAYLVSIDRRTPQAQQSEKRLQSRSINRNLSAVRSYLKFLIEIDFPSPLPPDAVKLVKTERKHAHVAELDELVKLIESPMTLELNPLIALRNRAMLEILFSTGMRISELINLNRTQIDKSGRIFITGKGKKERFVYLTSRATAHLQKYLARRTDAYPALFIPYRGRRMKSAVRGTGFRVSSNYLQAKIKWYRERLDINIPVSAHSLRHGFATYLAEKGANPAAIQILLGHESLTTTTRYVHASDRYAEKTHRQFHPLKGGA